MTLRPTTEEDSLVSGDTNNSRPFAPAEIGGIEVKSSFATATRC